MVRVATWFSVEAFCPEAPKKRRGFAWGWMGWLEYITVSAWCQHLGYGLIACWSIGIGGEE
jgi:hypothetical protein